MPSGVSASVGGVLGIVLAASSSFCSALGLSLVRKGSNIRAALASDKDASQQEIARVTKLARWYTVAGNVLLTAFTATLDLLALMFAPLELISPLSGATLVLNIFVAPWIVHERVHKIDVVAAGVMVPGLVLALTFGPRNDIEFTTAVLSEKMGRAAWLCFEAFIACIVACVVTLIVKSRKQEAMLAAAALKDEPVPMQSRAMSRLRRARPFLRPLLAAIVGAQQLVMTKLALMLLDSTISGHNQFASVSTYLVIVAAIGLAVLQISLVNMSLAVADALIVVPTYQSLLILFSESTSAIFMNTFSGYAAWKLAMFVIGVLTVMAGVLLLSQRPEDPAPKLDEADAPRHRPTGSGGIAVHTDIELAVAGENSPATPGTGVTPLLRDAPAAVQLAADSPGVLSGGSDSPFA